MTEFSSQKSGYIKRPLHIHHSCLCEESTEEDDEAISTNKEGVFTGTMECMQGTVKGKTQDLDREHTVSVRREKTKNKTCFPYWSILQRYQQDTTWWKYGDPDPLIFYP
ncbi:MAG TPA: hypothetical protein PKY89_07320 [Deltaproteobacteria bacterium]|nr:hypothetical protein [Deltaproteobacteria bacterium]